MDVMGVCDVSGDCVSVDAVGDPVMPVETQLVVSAFFQGDQQLMRGWWAVRVGGEGLREAAGRLGLSKDTLSRRIREFEAWARARADEYPQIRQMLVGRPWSRAACG